MEESNQQPTSEQGEVVQKSFTEINNQTQQIYPTPTTGPLADYSSSDNKPYMEAVQPQQKSFLNTGVILFILLLLTFFTPAGAVLFFPMLMVGIFSAFKYVNKSRKPVTEETTVTGILFSLIKAIITLGLVIVLGILGLIAFVFIGFATGAIELDFGS